MEAERIPTVEEMVPWVNLGPEAIELAEKIAADAYDIRQLVSGIYTRLPVSVFFHPEKQAVGVYAEPGTSWIDETLTKQAAAHFGPVKVLPLPELLTGEWIKVAFTPTPYSQPLRTAGEWLGFFPMYNNQGQVTLPNSVYRSMLTSGLVGAGLGYGIGSVGEWMMPRKWKRGRLSKTLAMLGGAAGAVPSTIWGLSNLATGKSFGDPSIFATQAGAEPVFRREDIAPMFEKQQSDRFNNAVDHVCSGLTDFLKTAFESEGIGPWGEPKPPPSPLDVNIDYMGRTLWAAGANPQTAGITMGTLNAAQQMPGGRRPGWVTPGQMGQLAAHMGAGWLSGALVGSVLGALTGMPESAQEKLRQTGMYLGVVKNVMPAMFGD